MPLFRHESDVLCLAKTSLKNNSGANASFAPIGKVIEQGEWAGIPIVKEQPDPGYHNPITVQDVINCLNYFGMSREDIQGLQVMIISGRSPYTDELGASWAFGAYQVLWEETSERDPNSKKFRKKREPKENRLILWAQKIDLIQFAIGGEMRQGYYYRVQPTMEGRQVDRYLSAKALRREVLGDTVLHEIGHHVDIWHYGRFIASSKDRAKAETFAEKYSAALARGKIDKPAFEDIINGTYHTSGQIESQLPTGEKPVPPQAPKEDDAVPYLPQAPASPPAPPAQSEPGV
jgi:hypothetical protein